MRLQRPKWKRGVPASDPGEYYRSDCVVRLPAGERESERAVYLEMVHVACESLAVKGRPACEGTEGVHRPKLDSRVACRVKLALKARERKRREPQLSLGP